MTDVTEDTFAKTDFIGDIAIGDKIYPVTFSIWAGADSRLMFDPVPVSTEIYLLATKSIGHPGTTNKEFLVTGKSTDGKEFHSDRVYVRSHSFGSDGYWISMSTRVATLTVPLGEPAHKPFLRLWFRAFKSFRNPVIDAKLGKLTVQGKVKDVGADDMSGCVALQAHSKNPHANWRQEADAFLTHMHRGLAFAHGGRLQAPRLDYIHDAKWEATFYGGRGFTSELSVQPQLNQGPFIEALVARYEKDGPLPEILWTAIGWMQIDTTFDEVRFLTAMTALETIVEHELPEPHGRIIPKEGYLCLRNKLKAVIMKDETLTAEDREIFCGKIDQNNQKVLAQKIDTLFDHYGLPRQDFEGDVIRNLTVLRNNIVHKGVVPGEVNIWPQIILVRELITRIVLREIGFVGRYECYVGGHGMKDFPDRPNPTESAPL